MTQHELVAHLVYKEYARNKLCDACIYIAVNDLGCAEELVSFALRCAALRCASLRALLISCLSLSVISVFFALMS